MLNVHALLMAIGWTLVAHSVGAQPTRISYETIAASTTESFESYAVGPTSVAEFQGFSISFSAGTVPGIYSGYFCSSQCLIDWAGSDAVRRLTAFAPGTTQVGLSLDSFWRLGYPSPRADPPDTFVVTVAGNSGTLEFSLAITDKEWFGFQDPAGLVEVAFTNLGSGSGSWNYSFDDVVTGAPVPEPATGLLLACGLIVLVSVRRAPGGAQ